MVSNFTIATNKVRGKARPRVTNHGTYIPKATRDAQAEVVSAFNSQCGLMHDGAVSVWIEIQRHLPKSELQKRVILQSDTMKPDVDNVAKLIFDALNGVAWKDDRFVTDLHVIKLPRMQTENNLDYINIRIVDMPTINKKREK